MVTDELAQKRIDNLVAELSSLKGYQRARAIMDPDAKAATLKAISELGDRILTAKQRAAASQVLNNLHGARTLSHALSTSRSTGMGSARCIEKTLVW